MIPHATVLIVPHPALDLEEFLSIAQLNDQLSTAGYYGGVRLLKATCKAFYDIVLASGMDVSKFQAGFKMSYDSSIPRMVGLSGSSAIVLACFKCLMQFFSVTLDDLKLKKHEFPNIILNIEKNELGISAGLQDRVIQVYQGLVHMDFSSEQFKLSNIGTYTPYDISLLPELYLAYCTSVGGESGKVHSTVRERWINRDPELCSGMQLLGSLTDSAVECLLSDDREKLAELMDLNFATRRKLYGDSVVGLRNIEAVELATKQLNLAAKFTGSGGALVCLPRRRGW